MTRSALHDARDLNAKDSQWRKYMEGQQRHVRVPPKFEVKRRGFSNKNGPVNSDANSGRSYIESRAPVRVGDIFYFTLKLPTKRSRLRGEMVYRHTTIHFGVRFRNLTARRRSEPALLEGKTGNQESTNASLAQQANEWAAPTLSPRPGAEKQNHHSHVRERRN